MVSMAEQEILDHNTHSLPDLLRIFQSNQLYENCKLTPLYVYRTAISQSFDNQVLAR